MGHKFITAFPEADLNAMGALSAATHDALAALVVRRLQGPLDGARWLQLVINHSLRFIDEAFQHVVISRRDTSTQPLTVDPLISKDTRSLAGNTLLVGTVSSMLHTPKHIQRTLTVTGHCVIEWTIRANILLCLLPNATFIYLQRFISVCVGSRANRRRCMRWSPHQDNKAFDLPDPDDDAVAAWCRTSDRLKFTYSHTCVCYTTSTATHITWPHAPEPHVLTDTRQATQSSAHACKCELAKYMPISHA